MRRRPGAPDELSAAIEAKVARFAALVRSAGSRRRLSDADLDEVMQDVRIRLWRSCGTGEQISRLGSSYVHQTATSAAVDLLRRRRAGAAGLTDPMDEDAEIVPAEVPGPEREVEGAELGARVLEALDALPLSRRAVVRMYLSGYERHEIEDLLGWSEGKTRNLLYRGLADLRSWLAERGITEAT